MRILTYDKKTILYNDCLIPYSCFLFNLPNYNEIVELNDKSCSVDIMDYIIYFLNNHHIFNEKKTDSDYIILWNNRFFDLPDNILFEIIKATNYLDIECLFELACNEVANIVKRCYTPQNVCKRFNIKDDITPEEEHDIYKKLCSYKII
jgi:hypothetical protein